MSLLAVGARPAARDVPSGTSIEVLEQLVDDAAARSAPLVVLVRGVAQGPGEDDELLDGLLDHGYVVHVWSWAVADLPRYDSVLARAVTLLPAVLVDVALDSPSDALAAVEIACHAGCLTVLHDDSPALSPMAVQDRTTSAAAAELADVLVRSDGSTALAGKGPALLVERFGVDEVLRLVGHLDLPVTDLTLTVLVTTYERPAELAKCLEALTRQTLPTTHFDVVVVDDASGVDPAPVVAGFADRLSLTYLRMPVNSGAGAARGAGLHLSTGDIVLLMDDDDVASPRVLAEHLSKHHEMRGEDVAVLGHTVVRPDDRSDVLSRHVTRQGGQYFSYGTMPDGHELPWHWFWGGRSSAKRSLLERFPFRGAFMEDTDVAWRAHVALATTGSGLHVIYARRAVQVTTSPLSLSAMRRRQTKMGRATGLFLPTTGVDVRKELPAARRAVAQRDALPDRLLADLTVKSTEALTAVRGGSQLGSSLGRLDNLLRVDLTAHHAVGMLAAVKMGEVLAAGGTPALGIDALHPDLVPVLAATAPGGGLRLVVRVAPADVTVDRLVEQLTAALFERGRTLDSIGDVELRVCDTSVEDLADTAFTVTVSGDVTAPAHRGLVLFGLSPVEWVQWFDSRGSIAGGLR